MSGDVVFCGLVVFVGMGSLTGFLAKMLVRKGGILADMAFFCTVLAPWVTISCFMATGVKPIPSGTFYLWICSFYLAVISSVILAKRISTSEPEEPKTE